MGTQMRVRSDLVKSRAMYLIELCHNSSSLLFDLVNGLSCAPCASVAAS